MVLGSPKRYGMGRVSSLRSFLERVTREHSHTMTGDVKGVRAMLPAPWHRMVCPLPSVGKVSAHEQFYSSPSSAVSEGEHEGGHEHRHKGSETQVSAGRQLPKWLEMRALITFLHWL